MESDEKQEPRKKNVAREFYNEDDIRRSLISVEEGKQTIYGAAISSGVPESTLRYRLCDKWSKKTRKGPQTVLSEEEELKLVDWIKGMQRKGFPIMRETLKSKIKSFFVLMVPKYLIRFTISNASHNRPYKFKLNP